LLLGCMSTVAFGMIAPWPLAGTALLSLLLPVMLCLAGSVIYHTLMANHWNYKTYITIDVSSEQEADVALLYPAAPLL